MEEKKNLAEEYLAKVREDAIYFRDYPNMPLYREDKIKMAFNAGRESVMENMSDLKWEMSSEDMIAKTPFGTYSFRNNSNALWFSAYNGFQLFLDTHKTFEDAKGVAYNDYKKQIKEVLGL
nr:MAG TPA: hypothetical protein [Caudoviricetes sp.]